LGQDIDIDQIASMLDFDFNSGSISMQVENKLKKFLNEYKPIRISATKDQ
jgi:hypothetical protein